MGFWTLFLFTLVVVGLYVLRQRSKRAQDEERRWARSVATSSYLAPAVSVRPALLQPRAKPLPKRGSLSGLVYEMEYGDADGVVTTRVIRLKEVYRSEDSLLLRAFCYLRDDERTFRADRILQLLNHHDGSSIVSPKVYFEQFVDPVPTPAEPGHAAAMNRAKPGLRALIWIARADRHLSEAETETLLAYFGDRLNIRGSTGADLNWDRNLARLWIENERPTMDDAAGAISRMSPRGEELQLVRSYADRLANLTDEPTARNRAKRLKLVA